MARKKRTKVSSAPKPPHEIGRGGDKWIPEAGADDRGSEKSWIPQSGS